jgi:hypothetical protein
VKQLRLGSSLSALCLVVFLCTTVFAATPGFTVPQDVAFRIRLDDTLTSTDSEVGDPFSATVVQQGEYRGARVYGHISAIDNSGRLKGNTEMVLQFNRLVMPDGRSARIHAEIIQLFHAPSHETLGVENAILSGGRGRSAVVGTGIGAGAGALLGAIFGGGQGAGIGSIVGGAAGLGTTAFRGPQKVTLPSGLEMMIQITQ